MPPIREPILALTPFERPDERLAIAAARAGALAILDLGHERARAREALAAIRAELRRGFGVRLPVDALVTATELLDAGVACVLLPSPRHVARWRADLPPRIAVLAQVVSLVEAHAAIAAGADALVAKGAESGGRIGDEPTFVLLQRLHGVGVPIFAQGGIGLHTAPAAIAGGASGVVLDVQLCLARESSLDEAGRALLRGLDGSETVVVEGHRLLERPDALVPRSASAAELAARIGASDQSRLWAVGQDIFVARAFAERYRTVGSIVTALRDAIGHEVRRAASLMPFSEGSPLARAHGLRFPIFQGPMTRVSDRAAFAASVAEGGALPFLALALLRGDDVRRLVRETHDRLGGRPFGVGILGFVPPELRDEQLAALEGMLPPVALIAGGRPSQARPLEARGTATYLHVPSPGLLELFLGEGARRFVFEGSECGGHVGPRTSFALWEAQLSVLASFPEPEALHIVFAGGIHDARSAAMVAAMAAPICARGAKIGVLMGTAYVFTREAVASGAILEGFQREVLRCERTALLETAPGHATRCAESPFVDAFEAAKARLTSDGVAPKQAWAELEALNLGRLRIASKGLVRRGDALVSVDEEEQRREGLFMIGQVAALRSEVTDVATLHGDIEASRVVLAQESARVPVAPPKPAAVAIVGMACVFPGAPDLDAYWSNIVRGASSITEVPAERWNAATYYDPSGRGDKTPSKWGGFLSDVPFDPAAFGIPPKSLVAIEPVQLLALEIARRALADAGYDRRPFDRERASVIFGAEAGTDLAGGYGFRALWPQFAGALPAELDAVLPALTEDSFPGVLANVIAGRIANRLDLGGVNFTVDAACASSLAAVELAVKELSVGTSDLVVCGGADLHNSIQDYLLFASVHALSPRGQCRTFDKAADGIVLGEGVAALVLKRLEDAERDGDRVYAVIRAVAGSSDGRSLGLTAPHKDGQVRALERAYRQAGIAPSEVGLVEAHGTGTVVGDRTELATLTEVYRRAGSPTAGVALGSVKSQIGHTKCAAGLAGLIKVALSVERGVLPPTLHLDAPNPYWKADESPFFFLDEARPWMAAERRGAISAFGFGGTNFHALVERHGESEAAPFAAWPAELFLVRAKDDDGALGLVRRALARLDAERPPSLRDLARAVDEAGEGPTRLAFVASSVAQARGLLEAAARGEAHPKLKTKAPVSGPVAFLFPGQGSQRVGMLSELFVAWRGARRWLERAPDVARRMFPGRAFSPDGRAAQESALRDTRMAQPALGVAGRAVADLLVACGVRPAMVAGHSYGELAALAFAGALDDDAFLALSRARAEHILAAAGDDPGAMAAVSAPEEKVRELVGELPVVVANHNAPTQLVLSGPSAAIAEALRRLEAGRVAARAIPVACAFHSPVVAGASRTLADYLRGLSVRAPLLPVWSNAGACPYEQDPDAIRARVAAQVGASVRFDAEIRAMHDAGARIFVEAGPGRVLTGLVGKILGDRPHVALACDAPGESFLVTLLDTLATLAVAGVPVDARALFDGRTCAEALDGAASWPATQWWVNGQRARPQKGESPKGGLVPVPSPVVRVGAGAEIPSGPADDAVVEYLRNMQSLAEAQRDVMLRFLGETVLPTATTTRAPVTVAQSAASAGPAEAPVAEAHAAAEETSAAVDVGAALLEIVSARTGYPVEMLGLDLDLEAELSIDSIKRIEILGELAKRTGLGGGGGDRDHVIEQLASKKTLRAILDFLARVGDAGDAPATADSPQAGGVGAGANDDAEARAEVAVTPELIRGRVTLESAALPSSPVLWAGRRVDVAGSEPWRGALEAAVVARGAQLVAADGAESPEVFVDASALAPGSASPIVRGVFERIRGALARGAKSILVLAPARSEGRALGMGGLARTLRREASPARVVVAHLASGAVDAERALSALGYDAAEVHLDGSEAKVPVVTVTAPSVGVPALDADAVILVTGGGRGITARLCRALARACRCRFELVGRTPLRDDDALPPDAPVHDPVALRRYLAGHAPGAPLADIEARAHRIAAATAIRETIAEIEAAGGRARYHALDVRDGAAVEALVARIYAETGRVDGVLHGAGVIEDRRFTEKTDASFARVYETKEAGASALARALRDDVRFVAFFTSVSGLFGNAGQVDYAAANAALDELAHVLSSRWPGRVLAVDCGPWAGDGAAGGMVSAELARELARRGIGLLATDEGVAAFLAELAAAFEGRADPEVFLARGRPQAFE